MISIRGVLVTALMLCLTAITVNSAVAGDYDSLTAYRAVARAMTGYTTGTISNNDLDYLINMSARVSQVLIGSKVIIYRIAMNAYTLQYALPDTCLNVLAVIHKTSDGKIEESVTPVSPEVLGKPMANPGLHYYTVVGQNLIIGSNSKPNDSLLIYYIPQSQRMTATSDAAGIETGDDVAVALLVASFISANRKDYNNQAFWWGVFNAYIKARKGQPVAQQD